MKLEKEVYVKSYTAEIVSTGNGMLMPFHLMPCERLTKKEFDIFLKISGAKKIKLTLEAEEPIIDDVERKYLSSVIKPFRNQINYISKRKCRGTTEYILIALKEDLPIQFPYFNEGLFYKRMERNKKYTLEELGL